MAEDSCGQSLSTSGTDHHTNVCNHNPKVLNGPVGDIQPTSKVCNSDSLRLPPCRELSAALECIWHQAGFVGPLHLPTNYQNFRGHDRLDVMMCSK